MKGRAPASSPAQVVDLSLQPSRTPTTLTAGAFGLQDEEDPDDELPSMWSRLKSSVTHDSQFLPLIAAVAAPMSTLLDIPALTQNWYHLNGAPVSDPRACIILSAFSLTTNVLANVLLVRRFTVGDRQWQTATVLSTVAWWIKITFAIVNLSIFGAFARNEPGFAYSEGFWCAVGSCIISGIIVAVLMVHAVAAFDTRSPDARRIRVVGAEFILIVMIFVSMIGLEAIYFSRVEGWTFFIGIYFSLVTVTTIGFGDFVPVTTAGRVVLFPFAVISIALLAAAVGVFVDFLSRGAEHRRRKWRARYEKTVWSKRAMPARVLADEVKQLRKLEDREDFLEHMFQLVASTVSLSLVWVVGAVVFYKLEGYGFGIALYFCYTFFLTVGYGDFAPKSAGGRVFFVVYALITVGFCSTPVNISVSSPNALKIHQVPFVANFVVNTVSSILYSLSSHRFRVFRARHFAPPTAPHRSHAHYVDETHKRLMASFPAGREGNTEAISRVVLGLAIRLEAQATNLLIDALQGTGRGSRVLRADRNLQRRALKILHHEPVYHTFMQDAMLALGETAEDVEHRHVRTRFDMSAAEAEQLEKVTAYRETFGALLAAGSMLMALDGKDRYWFERRLSDQHESLIEEDSEERVGMASIGADSGPASAQSLAEEQDYSPRSHAIEEEPPSSTSKWTPAGKEVR